MTLQMITETTTVASPPPPLVPDLDEAERFLAALDPFEIEWAFQTFTDMRPAPRPDPLARVLRGPLEDVADQLTRLNQRGAGVFVTINVTDGKGRNKENITAIRALWQEADRGDEPPLPVEPHIEVQSSPGKAHRYLLVEGLPLAEFEAAQQIMVDHFGSDPAAKDRARVLRLPGFYHVKDPSQPHLVRLIHESGAQHLAWEDLKGLLPAAAQREKAAPIPGVAGPWNGNVVPKPQWPRNRAEIESALESLDPDMGYESWIKVGMALHQESGGAEDAQELWDSWSAGSGSKYTPDGCSDKWRSFSAKGVNGTNIGSLFWLAKGDGWAGWKEPSVVERLQTAAQGLSAASQPQEIEKILRDGAKLGHIDQDRLHQIVKERTGLALTTLRKAGQKPKKPGDVEDVDQLTLAKAIRHAVGAENIIGQESGVWIYREEIGIWRALSPREERQLVQKHLEVAKHQEQIEAVSKGLVDGVTDVFKSEVHREDHEWEQGCDEAVSTPGGVMTLVKGGWERKPHRREDYRTVQIPVDWDPEATAPRFARFLEEIFAPDGEEEAADKATALLEMMGYSLMAHARHEKFIILVGEGSNGKSVLLAVLEKLLGKHNVAGVQPSQFDHPFQRAHLHLKLANVVTEVSQGEVIADAELKGITSGETSTVERKYQNPFNLKPYSTCWFGTNHLPHTRDFSDALFRRALVVRFNRKFDEQDPENLTDPHLKEELFQELPGILRLCLNAYAEALNRRTFTEPKSCKEAKQAWRLEADQAAQFIEDACLKDGKTGSTELFQAYLTWANEQGIKHRLSHKTFSERLMRLGYSTSRTRHGMNFEGLTLHNAQSVPAWEREFA